MLDTHDRLRIKNTENTMQYKIVKSITLWGLARKVSRLIVDGWKPQGGIQRSLFGCLQAMVKE